MLPDELVTFSRPIKDCTLVTREHVCKPGAMSRHLVLRFLKFAADGDGEATFAEWTARQTQRDTQGIAAALIWQSVVNRVVEPSPAGFEFDIVTETWFAHPDALARFHEDEEGRDQLNEAISSLCDAASTVTFVAQVNHARPPIED